MDKLNVEALMLLGEELQQSGDWDAAKKAYQQVLDLDNDSAIAHWKLGDIYNYYGNYSAALAHKQQALTLQPNLVSAETHNQMAISLIQQGKYEDAIVSWQRAVAVKPEYVDAHYNLGTALFERGNLDGAINHYKTVINLQPDYTAAYYNLSAIFTQQQQWQLAIDFYEMLLALNPHEMEAYVNLGALLFQQNRLDDSAACYEKLLEIQPQSLIALCGLGNIYGSRSLWSEAIDSFQKAIAIDSNYTEAFYNLGITLFKQDPKENIEEAISYLHYALELNPNYAEALCNLGSIIINQREYTEAIIYLQKSLEIYPNYADAYYNLGRAYSCQEDPENAIASYYRATELKPDFGDAYWNLFKLIYTSRSNVVNFEPFLRKITQQYKQFCGDKSPILTRIAFIFTCIFTSFHDSSLKEDVETLEELIYTQGSNLTEEEISNTYFLLFFHLLSLHDDVSRNNSFMRFLSNLHIEKIIKPNQTKIRQTSLKVISDIQDNKKMANPSNDALRIGFISPNFKRHSIGWCSGSIIRELSKITPHIHLYVSDRLKTDDLTTTFQQNAEKFFYPDALQQTSIDRLEIVRQLIEQIQQDNLDVLIDLDSVTAISNIDIIYARPAPVCISWMGGDAPFLSANNFYLGDRYTLPKSVESHYLEKLLRMPDSFLSVDGIVCEPVDRNEARQRLGISNEQIAYLSMIPGRKLNPDTARAQVEILKYVPNSIFLYKGGGDFEMIRSLYQRQCEILQVDFQRLKFLKFDYPEEKHRTTYLVGDILLDSYPFNGGTLSTEALWFNLPLVTHIGEQFFSRMGYSFLSTLGITEGIAKNWDEYREWGIRYGLDREFRYHIKQQLIQSKQPDTLSPLWNPQKFARDLYKILREQL